MDSAIFNRISGLHKAVRELQPNTKKALYSSAMGNVFNRSTWKGCALNQASKGNAQSTTTAAAYFNEPANLMGKFISAWDKFSDAEASCEQATLYLIDILQKIGLDTSPEEAKAKKFTFTLEIVKKDIDVEGWLNSPIELSNATESIETAGELLFASV